MATATVDQHPYESVFVVPPETGQDKIDGFIEKLKSTITKEKGNLRGVQVWGRRRLAYSIKQYKDGLYIYVDFDAPIQTVKSLNSLFHVTDFVIRHITVQREEFVPFVPRSRSKPKDAPPRESQTTPPAAAAQKQKPSTPKPKEG